MRALENFKTFCTMRNKSKKLTRLLSMGTCVLIGKFGPRSFELSVSTPQAGALMLFNDSAKLSFKEITEKQNVAEDDVIRLLHSLSCTKYKIMCKEPDTISIGKNGIFTFNSKFTDRSRWIKVLLEFKDYATEVEVDFLRKDVHAIGRCAIKLELASVRCISVDWNHRWNRRCCSKQVARFEMALPQGEVGRDLFSFSTRKGVSMENRTCHDSSDEHTSCAET